MVGAAPVKIRLARSVQEPMRRRLAAVLTAASVCVASPVLAAPLDEPREEVLPSLVGHLVDTTDESVTIRDEGGTSHIFRLTGETRYVYSATSQPSDLRPGARVRAEYQTLADQRVALAVWVISGPRS